MRKKTNIKLNFLRNENQILYNFYKKKNIDKELKYKIKNYLEGLWIKEQLQDNFEEKPIISKLSTELKNELFMDIYGKFFKENGFFHYLSKRVFKEIICSGEVKHFIHNEIILKVNIYSFF